MTRQGRAYLHAAAAVMLWSTVATAFKMSLRVLSPTQLLLMASWVSLALFFVILLLQGKLRLLRENTWRQLVASAALGLINPFAYYLILFKAYSLLPGQEAQPLNLTWGIVLPLLSVPLLGQKIRPASFLAILISFAGVYVISVRGDLLTLRFSNPLGTGLALGSSVLWALYWILGLRDRRDEVVKLFLNFLFGSFFILLWTLATGEWRPPSHPALWGGVYVGCFEMGLTFILWLKALRLSRSTAQVANFIFIVPFISLVLLHFVAGEDIHASSLCGLLLIVAGILLQKRLGGDPESADSAS